MNIDWFTVVAQVINFLVLVGLLKRYLYKPVLQAIDDRETGIVSQIQHAESLKAEAEKEKEEFLHKNEELKEKRQELLDDAENQVKVERQRLFEEARKEYNSLRSKLAENLQNEQKKLSRKIIGKARDEIFLVVRKTLSDLASASLEEQMVETFICRIKELKRAEKELLTTALNSSSGIAVVRSVFDISSVQQQAIDEAIREIVAVKMSLRFETSSTNISGIELTTNDYKVSWNINDYLSSMEKSIADLLNNKSSLELKFL